MEMLEERVGRTLTGSRRQMVARRRSYLAKDDADTNFNACYEIRSFYIPALIVSVTFPSDAKPSSLMQVGYLPSLMQVGYYVGVCLVAGHGFFYSFMGTGRSHARVYVGSRKDIGHSFANLTIFHFFDLIDLFLLFRRARCTKQLSK